MLDWVMAPGDARPLLRAASSRALDRGALAASLIVGCGAPFTVVAVDLARARRPISWPDEIVDWAEIHEAAPYPGSGSPALARVLSELGAPAFAVYFDPDAGEAAVAWFEKGALLKLERVGKATVAWAPGEGLGRPDMAGLAGGAASLARRLGGDGDLLDRIEAQHAAGARAIVERVLVRLCDRPPAIDELAGTVATAAADRWTAG